MTDEGQYAWLERPTQGFFEAASSMAAVELRVAIDGDEPPVGYEALAACGDRAAWVETHLLGDERVVAAMVFSEEVVQLLGARVLMLPEVSPEATEEVEMAFNEVVNVGIGTWNRDVGDDGRRWDNSVAARRSRRLHAADGAGEYVDYRVVGGTLSVEGRRFPFAIAGSGAWLPAGAQVIAPRPAPEAASDAQDEQPSAPRPAGPEGATTGDPVRAARQHAADLMASVQERGGDEPGAQLVVIDVSGAFVEWFTEQLKNPDFVFTRANGAALEQGDYRAVLLVNPQALHDAKLQARNHIVMRRS